MSQETGPEPAPAPGPVRLSPYRTEALTSVESSERLEELLPVTSLRLRLLAVAAALIVGALIAYAAVTPRNVIVQGEGRVVGDGGIGLVTSTATGQFGSFTVAPGTHLTVGQRVADVITATGPVAQYSQVEGDLLGYLPSAGAPIDTGEWLAQVSLKQDDGSLGLITVLPEDAGKVLEGMPVTVTILGQPEGPTTLTGRIGPNRSQAYDPDIVQEGLGTLEPPPGPRVVIEVVFDTPGPSGYEFTGTILVSERTLLQQLLGLS